MALLRALRIRLPPSPALPSPPAHTHTPSPNTPPVYSPPPHQMREDSITDMSRKSSRAMATAESRKQRGASATPANAEEGEQ